MATQASQPPISADPQWPGQTSGPKPAVSMPLRRAPSGSQCPSGFFDDIRICRHLSAAIPRGSARIKRVRNIFLRAPRLRCALHADQPKPLPTVLQPSMSPGFAPSDRTGTTLAPTRTTSVAPGHRQTITRALSSLTGIFTVPHQALNCHCPQRRKEREGLGHPPGSPLPFSNSCSRRRGDDPLRRRSGISCATR